MIPAVYLFLIVGSFSAIVAGSAIDVARTQKNIVSNSVIHRVTQDKIKAFALSYKNHIVQNRFCSSDGIITPYVGSNGVCANGGSFIEATAPTNLLPFGFFSSNTSLDSKYSFSYTKLPDGAGSLCIKNAGSATVDEMRKLHKILQGFYKSSSTQISRHLIPEGSYSGITLPIVRKNNHCGLNATNLMESEIFDSGYTSDVSFVVPLVWATFSK